MDPDAIDFRKANAVIDDYVAALSNPANIPTRVSNRVWIEFALERHGVIRSVRSLRFGESHAIWYACLIKTKRVRQVSRLEKTVMPIRSQAYGGSTERTIRRMLKGNLVSTVSAVQLRNLLEPHPALALWGRMFDEAERDGRMENPSYWVERSVFLDRCQKEGVRCPEHLPDILDWEEKIGLRGYVRARLDDYYRRTGLERDPMTAGALRLERAMKRSGIA